MMALYTIITVFCHWTVVKLPNCHGGKKNFYTFTDQT